MIYNMLELFKKWISTSTISFTVIYGIDVDMNENFTATVGEVGEINCSFSKENIQTLYTVGFFSRNKTTHIFEPIVTFRPNEVTVFTPAGEYLRSRVTVTNITHESNEANILFNHLKCTDQTQYLCEVTYFSSTRKTVVLDRSLPTTINVTGKFRLLYSYCWNRLFSEHLTLNCTYTSCHWDIVLW